MVKIDVSIELGSPLLLGSWRLGNVFKTVAYLPGSVLRGAVADFLLRDQPEKVRLLSHPDECPDRTRCEFCRIFNPMEGQSPRFGDCYPAAGYDHPLPLPISAQTCKHNQGFLRPETDDGEDRPHGIMDTLIRQAAFEDALRERKQLLYHYLPDCPTCGGQLCYPYPGYYALMEHTFYIARPFNRRFSRTAISRVRGAAEHGLLYTLEVMEERMGLSWDDKGDEVKHVTTLRGEVWTIPEQAEAMCKVLKEIECLGAGRSRGLGRVMIKARVIKDELDPLEKLDMFLDQVRAGRFKLTEKMAQRMERAEPLTPANLVERLLAFNWALQAERGFWAKMDVPVLNGEWYFTFDLLSDTFVQNGSLPTLQLDPATTGLVDEKFPVVSKVRSWVDRVYRSGWSGVKRLPRPVILAAAAGSVYLYRVHEASQDMHRALVERLALLEDTGIGQDRERGAGRLMVCAPFHLEVEPR